MMKRFWIIVCGSFVGVWLASIILSVISIIFSLFFIGSITTISSSVKSVDKNSVLLIDLGITVSERDGSTDPLNPLSVNKPSSTGLTTIIKGIQAAADNYNVTAICLECNGISAGCASLKEIRDALTDFKASGKRIYAYGDNISQSDYYLASVADSIFLDPTGAVDIHGLASSSPFFKGLLDKLGIEMQVIRVGTFKSAVEPYILSQMSQANRLQREHYMANMWSDISQSIAEGRDLTKERIHALADSLTFTKEGEWMISSGLVDDLCYRHQMTDRLRRITKVDSTDDPRTVGLADVIAAAPKKSSHDDRIAIIFAEGEIDGSDDNDIHSEKLCEQIVKLARDKDVKGLVLRVNSPGGSAQGSEIIWSALEEFKREGKPFAVSMGDYAASGGYYISCGADRIFAEPTTITGSIGIFAMVPCFENFSKDKLGINWDIVATNESSAVTTTKRLSDFQKAQLQKRINSGYELFTSRCAIGRDIDIDSIKVIAEGRVWDGTSALELGLIDQYGNLESAIEWVALQAELTNYSIDSYPVPEDKLLRYISRYTDTKIEQKLKENTGDLYQYHDFIRRLMNRDQILCIMEPVEIQ